MRRYFSLARWTVGVELSLAPDGYWHWDLLRGSDTQATPDRLIDVASIHVVRREGEPPLVVATLGPILVGVIAGRA